MEDTADIKGGDNAQTVAAGQLRALIERIERLEEDKQSIRRGHPRSLRRGQGHRLRHEGDPHDHPVAEEGHRRAPGRSDHPGALRRCAGADGGLRMTPISVFAIRRPGTSEFMPNRSRGPHGDARGFTNDEPTAAAPPRLFSSRRNAHLALQQWLKGPIRVHSYQDHTGEWDECVSRNPHTRKPGDLEIVELTLVLKP